MLKIQCECEGLSPLLMDAIPPEALDNLKGGRQQQPEPPDTPLQQLAEKKLYRENGTIGIPGHNLFSCLVEAGRGLQFEKKRNISTADSTLLPSFLTIDEFFLPLQDGAGWTVDKRGGRNKEGGLLRLVRPRFDKWGFRVTLLIDNSQISEERVKLLVVMAGSRVGLCSFRPAKKGPFGRFRIKEWRSEKIES